MRVGFLAAMRSEVPAVLAKSEAQAGSGRWHSEKLSLAWLISGPGRRRAARATSNLCRSFLPDLLLAVGFCGGVADCLQIGDVVAASRVSLTAAPQAVPEASGADGRGAALELAEGSWDELRARLSGQAVQVGEIETHDRVVLSRRGVSPAALAVDMEAYAIAEVARQFQVRCVVTKVVSDLVPERGGPLQVARWAWHFRSNLAVAGRQIDRLGEAYLELLQRTASEQLPAG